LAAEAKHHWPITEPSVSGQPLPYHYFVNIHMAGASQVTGIGLPLVYLRLYLLPMIVLLVLELVVAGRSFVRSARVGLAAAGLAIFVGQLRLDNRHTALSDTPFLGPFFTYLFRSPSFLFGLIIFVPLMALLGERLAERRKQAGAGEWVLIALLMVGASDAKVVILPVVLTALVLHSAVTWGIERRIPVAAWWGIGLTILVMGSVYVMQYSGHPSELRVHPLEVFGVMPAVGLLKAYAAGGLPAFPAKDILLSGAAVVFGLVGFLGPQLAGLVFMLRRGVLRVAPAQRWLMAMLGAALVLGLTFSEPGTANELYFVGYGLVAGCILSAEGLRIAWTKRRDGAPSLRPVVIAGVVWLVALAALMAIPPHVGSLSGPQREPHLYLVWYAGLLVALGVLLVAARRWLAPTWRAAGLIGCAAVVSVGVLDAPGIYLAPALAHRGTSVNKLFKPMSPELYRSLSWVRDRTAPGAVIAVNNQWLERGRAKPFEFDYSAFAERRVFLEGWAYSQGVRDRGFLTVNANPFPERLRLNEAAFLGDRRALAVMRRDYGVRYLLVDPDGGERADIRALRQTLRIVRQPPVPVFALR
jgi:hypothetical protein